MRILYHWPLDPGSRQARLALAETKLKFKLEPVNPWKPDEGFLKLCLEGTPPCLIETTNDGRVPIYGSRAICEYAHETTSRFSLLPETAIARSEARRICDWFDTKFSNEVNAFLMYERVEKALTGSEAPHPPTLREGRNQLVFHLDYMSWLLEQREWLAGKTFSLADISAGAHISCLDFLGEVPWKNYPSVKLWYQKLKSRPSFRPLLSDKVAGLIAPRHYADLDF